MFRVPTDSAHDFYKLGSEFLKAAHLVFEKSPELDFPGYALIGQAIELYLKAYLRAKGQSVNDLKSVGHNLKSAFDRAENLGLLKHFSIEANEREALEKLSQVYQSKDFHYKNQGNWELPFPNWTASFANRLSQCVEPLTY